MSDPSACQDYPGKRKKKKKKRKRKIRKKEKGRKNWREKAQSMLEFLMEHECPTLLRVKIIQVKEKRKKKRVKKKVGDGA